MPTTIYTDKPILSVSHAGKSYPVEDGQVDVPDDAVGVLTEAHGFSMTPAAEEEVVGEGDDAKPVNKGGRPRRKPAAEEE